MHKSYNQNQHMFPTLGPFESSQWKVNAAGFLQEAGLVQTCYKEIPPLKGSTAGCGTGPPRKGLTHIHPHFRLKCIPAPLWHSYWSHHGCSFLFLSHDFLCAAKGWSRHQGRKVLG